MEPATVITIAAIVILLLLIVSVCVAWAYWSNQPAPCSSQLLDDTQQDFLDAMTSFALLQMKQGLWSKITSEVNVTIDGKTSKLNKLDMSGVLVGGGSGWTCSECVPGSASLPGSHAAYT